MKIIEFLRSKKLLSIIMVVTPLLLFTFGLFFKDFNWEDYKDQLYWVIFFLISIIAVSLLVLYLNKGTNGKVRITYKELSDIKNIIRTELKSKQSNTNELNELKNLINELANDISLIKTIELSDNDKQQLFDNIQDKIDSQLTADVLKSIDNKYGTEIALSNKYSNLLDDFNELRSRLSIEIRTLTRRSNLNLAIGAFTTIIAGVVLWYTVVQQEVVITDYLSIVSHYIPRLALIIFIEVFAFFFLKLYKANLDNIKYYHNELTNVELKIAALKSSLINEQKEVLSTILKELAKTERNYILKKGESTVELEKNKNHINVNIKVLKLLTELLNKKK